MEKVRLKGSWRNIPSIVGELIQSQHSSSRSIHQTVARVSSPHIQMWLHFDIMDNILCQVKGSKRVTLFPPSEVGNLYVKGSVSEVIDLDNVSQPQFPLFEKVCLVEPLSLPLVGWMTRLRGLVKGCGMHPETFSRVSDTR